MNAVASHLVHSLAGATVLLAAAVGQEVAVEAWANAVERVVECPVVVAALEAVAGYAVEAAVKCASNVVHLVQGVLLDARAALLAVAIALLVSLAIVVEA